ncbi:MAG: PulJ/GspJ family protein [Solirubrobacteraceae bacterium]
MTRRLRDEGGFTLAELQVSMTIMLVIAFAALLSLDTFGSGAATTSRLTSAEDAARRDVGRIVSVLRNAGAPAPTTGAVPATIIQALDNDLVMRSTTWPGESATGITGTHIVRLCLETATKTVWFDGLRAGTAGSSSPGSACPSTASGWTHFPIAKNVINSAANPLFRYGANPVRSVGLTLRTEGGSTAKSRPLKVDSGGALRGAIAPQVSVADITTGACENGRALLTLGLGVIGAGLEGAKMTAANAIPAGAGKLLVPATSAASNIVITITNVLGLQTLLTKSVSC